MSVSNKQILSAIRGYLAATGAPADFDPMGLVLNGVRIQKWDEDLMKAKQPSIEQLRAADRDLGESKYRSESRKTTHIELFSTLPETNNFAGRTVFNTTDQKLYIFSKEKFTPA